MDLHSLMALIADAFINPLRSAINGVGDVGLPIVRACDPAHGRLGLHPLGCRRFAPGRRSAHQLSDARDLDLRS